MIDFLKSLLEYCMIHRNILRCARRRGEPLTNGRRATPQILKRAFGKTHLWSKDAGQRKSPANREARRKMANQSGPRREAYILEHGVEKEKALRTHDAFDFWTHLRVKLCLGRREFRRAGRPRFQDSGA